MKVFGTILLATLAAGCTPKLHAEVVPPADQTKHLFLVRSTTKTPEAVADAVKTYAQAKNWQYLGAFKVKQGQVTLVKFCIPEVGKQLWPLGLELSAMLPCGNLGVYQKDGKTEISLLSPRYMPILYPDPAVEKASATAEPLLTEMLDAVAN